MEPFNLAEAARNYANNRVRGASARPAASRGQGRSAQATATGTRRDHHDQPKQSGTAAVRQRGTVDWFNGNFGFILPDGGGKGVFLHINQLEESGLGPVSEGQILDYEVRNGAKGLSAENLRLLS